MPQVAVALLQLLAVSAVGSEFYAAAFHKAMLERPPRMDLATYAAYLVAFVALALLHRLSAPVKRAETKSL